MAKRIAEEVIDHHDVALLRIVHAGQTFERIDGEASIGFQELGDVLDLVRFHLKPRILVLLGIGVEIEDLLGAELGREHVENLFWLHL
jgi:hypothetical protein